MLVKEPEYEWRTASAADDAARPTTTTSSPGARIVRNILAVAMGRGFSVVAAATLAVLLPRYLGDVNLGRLTFANSFTDLFGLAASLGISVFLVKEVARNPSSRGTLALNAIAVRVPLAMAAAVAAVLTATFMGVEEATLHVIQLFCINVVLLAISGVLNSVLQGLQEMRSLVVVDVLARVTLLGGVVLFAYLNLGLLGLAVAWNLWAVVNLVGCLVALMRCGGLGELKGRVDHRMWRTVLIGGLPFFVWEASLLAYTRIDTILLGVFASEAVIGWYAAAFRVASIPLLFPGMVMGVVFPALSSASANMVVFNPMARRAMHVVVLACVPLAFGTTILAERLVGLLGYPEGFANSVLPLMLLAPCLPLVGFNMIVASVLNARNRQRHWAMAGVAAAILNPSANLLAIPYTQSAFANGAIGAAAVNCLTELFLLTVGLRLLPGGVLDRQTVAGVLKCVLAGVIMAVAIWPARDLPLVLPVLIGGVVYAGASSALGTLSPKDLSWIKLQLTSRRRLPSEALS